MENKTVHVFLSENRDEYFTYVLNPTKELVYNVIPLLIEDKSMVKNTIATLDNFWVRDNNIVHSFIIKMDRNIVGVVVGNIRSVSSAGNADYSIFIARIMEVVPFYYNKFRELTSDLIFELNKKYNIKAIIGTDCGYKNTSNSLSFWLRPLRIKKNHKFGNIRITNPKKYLPKAQYTDKTKWILHDGKYNLHDIMNLYLLEKKITFVKYDSINASAFLDKNIKVYHNEDFTKIFAILEQPHDHKSCLVFYLQNTNPEEVAAFLYKNTKYEHMMLVIPGSLRKEIVMSIIDDIRGNLYLKNAEVANQILPNPDIEKFDYVPIGSELLVNIF